MAAPTRRNALAAGAAMATSLAARPVQAQPRTRVRFGTVAIASFGTPLYAQELGYFDEAGLDVRLELRTNPGAVVAAVIGRSFDVGIASIVNVAQAHARRIGMAFVAGAGSYVSERPTTVLAVARDRAYRAPRDLAGTVIATPVLHDLPQIAAQAWFAAAGVSPSAARYIELPFSTMARALALRRVAAATIAEPFVTVAGATIRIVGHPYDAIARRFMLGGVAATPRWLAAHPAAARGLARALERAATWGNEHRVEAAAIVSRYSKAPLELLTRMTPPFYEARLTAERMQPVIDAAARFGSIPRGFPAAEIIAREPGSFHG